MPEAHNIGLQLKSDREGKEKGVDSQTPEQKLWLAVLVRGIRLDWIEQCFMSPPTQYRLHGRRFLQVKRLNQQYQSTEGTKSTQTNQTYNKQT